MELIDAIPEAIESWWQAFRRNPDHPEAETALERLSPHSPNGPGELALRMEQELQRFPRSFPERRAMEIRLAPLLLAQGRSADAFQLFGMGSWLRGMQKRSEPRFGDFSRPHLWSVLTAYDPLAAESLLLRGLSMRSHEREAAPLFLRLLQQQDRGHELVDYLRRWQISESVWRRAREKVGWDHGEQTAMERYEEEPWNGDRLHHAHAELSESGRAKEAKELLEQGLHDLDLEAPDLRTLIDGDRTGRLPVLMARLEELLGPCLKDTDLHRDGLFQVGSTLALLGLREQALQAYRHLARLYPEDTPYRELRNLELGRTPTD